MQKHHETIPLKFQEIIFIIECMLSQTIHNTKGKIRAFLENELNIYILCLFHFKNIFVFLFLEREGESKTSIDCLMHTT